MQIREDRFVIHAPIRPSFESELAFAFAFADALVASPWMLGGRMVLYGMTYKGRKFRLRPGLGRSLGSVQRASSFRSSVSLSHRAWMRYKRGKIDIMRSRRDDGDIVACPNRYFVRSPRWPYEEVRGHRQQYFVVYPVPHTRMVFKLSRIYIAREDDPRTHVPRRGMDAQVVPPYRAHLKSPEGDLKAEPAMRVGNS